MENKLKRNQKIFLHEAGQNTFSIVDDANQTVVSADDEYFIYFKNVNFMPNGIIRGRYLGDDPKRIVNENQKRVVYTDNGWKYTEGSRFVKTARMVAVQNKSGVIVIIDSE